MSFIIRKLLIITFSLSYLFLANIAEAVIYRCPASKDIVAFLPNVEGWVSSMPAPKPVWASTTNGHWYGIGNTVAEDQIGSLDSMSIIVPSTNASVEVICNYKGDSDSQSHPSYITDMSKDSPKAGGRLKMYLSPSNCPRMPKPVQNESCSGSDSCNVDCGGPAVVTSATPKRIYNTLIH